METTGLVLWFFVFSGLGQDGLGPVKGPYYSLEECKVNRAAIYISQLNMQNVEPKKIAKFLSTRGRCFNEQEYSEGRRKDEIESQERARKSRQESQEKYDRLMKEKALEKEEKEKNDLLDSREINYRKWELHKAQESKEMHDRIMEEEQRKKVIE